MTYPIRMISIALFLLSFFVYDMCMCRDVKGETGIKVETQTPEKTFVRISPDPLTESIALLEKQIAGLNREINTIVKTNQSDRARLLTRADDMIRFADHIISWSAFLLALIATIIILISFAVGWWVSKLLSEIRKETKAFKSTQDEINKLKEEFGREKETAIKVLFPLVEGQRYYDEGKSKKALAKYKEASELKPNDPKIFSRLMKLLMENGKIDEAIKRLRDTFGRFETDEEIHLQLGKAYRRNDDYYAAENEIKKALNLNESSAQAHYEIGTIYLFNKKFDQAKRHLQRAIGYHRNQADYTAYWIYPSLWIAKHFLKDGDNNILDAEEIKIKERIATAPKNSSLWATQGLNRFCLKNFEQSYRSFKEAVKLGLPIELAKSMLRRINILCESEDYDPIEQVEKIRSLLQK